MHQPRFPREAFRGHTIVHHGIYRGDDSFFLDEGDHPSHILLKPYALPAIIVAHLPLIWAVDKFLVPNTAIGALLSMIAYFVIYEYMHWNMHIPRGHFVERFRWFQFLRTHHKLHHRYYQKNFCVLFPLADWVLGSMVTEASLERRREEREAAIAMGLPTRDQKPNESRGHARKRARMIRAETITSIKQEVQEFREQPKRARRIYRLSDVRELLGLGSERRK